MELQENSQICMIAYGSKADGLTCALYQGLGSSIWLRPYVLGPSLLQGRFIEPDSVPGSVQGVSGPTSFLQVIILLAIILQLFPVLSFPILYPSPSLTAHALSDLTEETGVSRRELSQFASTSTACATTLSLPSGYKELSAGTPAWGQTLPGWTPSPPAPGPSPSLSSLPWAFQHHPSASLHCVCTSSFNVSELL